MGCTDFIPYENGGTSILLHVGGHNDDADDGGDDDGGDDGGDNGGDDGGDDDDIVGGES